MLVGITCHECGLFLTEQPIEGVFVCRKCKLAYPYGEHGPNSIWYGSRLSTGIDVPIEDVIKL